MAALTITVPDGQVDRIREAFSASLPGSAVTPATVEEIKEQIRGYIRNRVLSYENQKAVQLAAANTVALDLS